MRLISDSELKLLFCGEIYVRLELVLLLPMQLGFATLFHANWGMTSPLIFGRIVGWAQHR